MSSSAEAVPEVTVARIIALTSLSAFLSGAATSPERSRASGRTSRGLTVVPLATVAVIVATASGVASTLP